MPLTLPPLNALRAFECAARHGSYVAAAKALHISAAAVSQHVRNLEGFLGKQLFTRHNNRVVLTDAGEEIFKTVHQALEQIAVSTARAMGRRVRSRLLISVLPSLGEFWLIPRLQAFSEIYPDFRFELREENDPVNFARDDIDLRMAYGANYYPELTAHFLLQDEVVPMCAPAYLERIQCKPEDWLQAIPDEDFIHIDWGPEFGSRPSWTDWLLRFGAGRSVQSVGHVVSHSGLAHELAERGIGVILGQRLTAIEALSQGRLIVLSDRGLPLGRRHALVHPKAKADKPMLQELVRFLGGGPA
ncbi:LysR substrate-binding domain-containing protein [Aestuariivirga litoralis]|uniref:LysR substrate-binding domain-containing protein n=1 Tax=Aestuariivirga litoralis TaxID=2650924 RepID=UPI0018C6DDD6|nr:LysR substrate-binding domain-containing protein [Aestuariivirga litoralis]